MQAKVLIKDAARRIAVNAARLPDQLGKCAENTHEYYAGKDSAVPTADKPDF